MILVLTQTEHIPEWERKGWAYLTRGISYEMKIADTVKRIDVLEDEKRTRWLKIE